MIGLDAALLAAGLGLALALRPWRALAAGGPPWPAWLLLAALPWLWSADRLAEAPLVQPMSFAPLLVLMLGWPLAVLALMPVGLALWALGGLDAAAALQRTVWLGVVPASLALLIGIALRRALPRHLFVYIMARAFLGTWVALALAGALALWLSTAAPTGSAAGDMLLARLLAASSEAVLTGMLTSIFVAFRPHWLATYTDRIYLPR